MAVGRLLVSCRSCLRAVALVPRIDSAALVPLEQHLRQLHHEEVLIEQPTAKETLRHFRIAAIEPRPVALALRRPFR